MNSDQQQFKVLKQFVQYLKERHYKKLTETVTINMFFKLYPDQSTLSHNLLRAVRGVEFDSKTKNYYFKTNRGLQKVENCKQLVSKPETMSNDSLIPLKRRHLLKTFVTNVILNNEINFVRETFCYLCQQYVANLNTHEQNLGHIFRESYRTDRKYFIAPYNYVKVECKSDSIKEELIVNKQREIFNLNIINKTDIILYFNLFELIPNKSISIQKSIPSCIKGNQKINIQIEVTCRKQSLLLFPILLLLNRRNEQEFPDEVALKDLVFRVQAPSSDDIIQTAAYRPAQKAYLTEHDQTIIKNAPSIDTPTTHLVDRMALKEYPLPSSLIQALNYKLEERDTMTPPIRAEIRKIRRLLRPPSTSSYPEDCLIEQNYEMILDLMLHIEEYQETIEISQFNKTGKQLRKISNHLYELKAENLEEHRPSILRGDRVIVIPELNLKRFLKYEGVIHEVRLNSIYIAFDKSFGKEYPKDTKYKVQFLISRGTTRKQHRAVQLLQCHQVKRFFFPTVDMLSPTQPLPKLKYFNSQIENNREQSEAVTNIVQGTSYPAPFLLFGPPGTGKTMTLVEAIKQIWKIQPHSHILVCAPSNSAANIITERLIEHIDSRQDLIRLLAISQDWDSLPQTIKPYVNYDEKIRDFTYPSLKVLKTFRIIIVTLLTAARLVSAVFPLNHFTHVFIDESGHATETEALVPIAGLLTSIARPKKIFGNIILAGDPMQLGPIIFSPIAKKYGFGLSILERLMTKIKLYQRDPCTNKYDSRVLTKLVRNFRSHPALLYLSNRKFYDNELIPCASKETSFIAVGWKELPNKEFPILFHASYGREERESNSPSYFNSLEIDIIMSYLRKIINHKLNPNMNRVITESDIGIIAPYKKQIKKLQTKCEHTGYFDIVIGSVEQFQGEEKEIIIMSTVRSREDVNVQNKRSILGFLTNPKRFNVALTRAKSLLIIVGNPNVLQYDEHWLDLIDYCDNNKALINKRQFRRDSFKNNLNEMQEAFSNLHCN